jgi:hypothetical protein
MNKYDKKLSVSIMAFHTREPFFEYLKSRLGEDIPFSVDDGSMGIWNNCKASWLLHDPKAEYHIVIQDDAIICDNFIDRASEIIKRKEKDGDFIFSFYAGQMMGAKITAARNRKKDCVISGMIFNEVALCMKTKHISDMIKWCDERRAETDQDIWRWAHLRRVKILYPLPSLIDHRSGDSIFREKYNKPKQIKERKAFWYAG